MGNVFPDISPFAILFTTLSFLFMAWPFVLLAGLQQRRNSFQAMLVLWLFLAVARVIIVFDSHPIWPSLLIQEPLNTSLFVLAGMVLFSALFLRKMLVKR